MNLVIEDSKKMKSDDVAVAKIMGWTNIERNSYGEYFGFNPDGERQYLPQFTRVPQDSLQVLKYLQSKFEVSIDHRTQFGGPVQVTLRRGDQCFVAEDQSQAGAVVMAALLTKETP